MEDEVDGVVVGDFERVTWEASFSISRRRTTFSA